MQNSPPQEALMKKTTLSSYAKLIARSGDVHWYAMAAQYDGAALFACAPEVNGLRLRMSLFGSDGMRQFSK